MWICLQFSVTRGMDNRGVRANEALNETIDLLAMANNVHWYGHVLRREDCHVLRIALHFAVEGQWKKQRLKSSWKKQVEEGSVKVGLRREDALF